MDHESSIKVKTKICSTTGQGATVISVLIDGLLNGKAPEKALIFVSAVDALCGINLLEESDGWVGSG